MTFALLLGLLVAGLTTALLTRGLLPLLRRRAMDRPNARSSHTAPTPRGGGIAVMAGLATGSAVIGLFVCWSGMPPGRLGLAMAVMGLALVLATLSWRDDQTPLPVWLRFGAQGIAVALGLALLMGWPWIGAAGEMVIGPISALSQPLLAAMAAQSPMAAQSLMATPYLMPLWLDFGIAWLAWMWVVNATNFMDGIDGITVADGVPFCAGWAMLVVWGAVGGTSAMSGAAPHPSHMLAGLVIAPALCGALLGFARTNWAPARVFLGDVGSIPIGYLIGFAILSLAMLGLGPAAVILQLYPLSDATWTLLKRLARRERVWEAHREHAYQRAAASAGHAAVSGRVAAVNVGLVAIALVSTIHPWPALVGAAGLVLALLWRLEAMART